MCLLFLYKLLDLLVNLGYKTTDLGTTGNLDPFYVIASYIFLYINAAIREEYSTRLEFLAMLEG